MIKFREVAASKWYELGQRLGVPNEFLSSVKFNVQQGNEGLVEVLDYWLRYHHKQPTVQELSEAVKDVTQTEPFIMSTVGTVDQRLYDYPGTSFNSLIKRKLNEPTSGPLMDCAASELTTGSD